MNFYKNKNYKEFPENRVCVIDFLPVVEDAIKDTYRFCINIGLPVHQWSKFNSDILNVFYHYSLDNICKAHKECPSAYRKVIAVYNIPRQSNSFSNLKDNIHTVLKVCPVPWCVVQSFNSPELGLAATNAFEKKKPIYSNLIKFAEKKHLHAFAKKIKKNRIYSNIIVDFSGVQE